MDLTKAQLLLNKINRLYKSMSLDPENVAQIEKDLMRDYIKQLYGAFLEENVSRPVTTIKKQASPPPRVEPKRMRPVQASPPPIEERIVAPPPVTKRIIAPPPVEEVVVVETPPPAPIHQPRASTPPPSFEVNEEGDQLFSTESGTDLSHKLSSLPIADLNKAMGINERIFTINELFRGDSRAFKHTMNELNQLSTFTEAKAYLMQNIVTSFDWTNKTRRNKAKNFIKLIRRRYI